MQPLPSGVYSHLCGSRVTESARSMPREAGTQLVRERERAAVRGVDVEPHPMPLRDVRKFLERLDHVPSTVVPAVATTAAGRMPAAGRALSPASSSPGST